MKEKLTANAGSQSYDWKKIFNIQFFAEDPQGTPPADPPQDPNGGNQDPTPPDGGSEPKEPKTFTQEDLDKIVRDRLAKEKGKYADFDKFKAASEELEKIKQSQMTEAEKQAEELKRLQNEANNYKLEAENMKVNNVKMQQLLKTGLPVELVGRIQGTTEEEVIADIEAFKALMPQQQQLPKQPIGGGTNPPPQDNSKIDLEALAKKARETGKLEDRVAYARAKAKVQSK